LLGSRFALEHLHDTAKLSVERRFANLRPAAEQPDGKFMALNCSDHDAVP
jgi:hypothetical protein